MKYYVRKSWEDEESQIGEYTDLEEAQKNLKPEYTIYDSNGQGLIGCARLIKPKIVRTNYPKMWEDLRNVYQAKLDEANRLIEDGYNDINPIIVSYKSIYKTFLFEMEKIENANTQIFEEI